MKQELTQESVRYWFQYDADTGILSRLQPVNIRDLAGFPVGCLRPDGYLAVNYARQVRLVHRIVWLHVVGKFPEGDIDHIDGNRANNKWSNLREVSRADNNLNRSFTSGTYLDKRTNTWRARLGVGYKSISLGHAPTKAEAEALYSAYKLTLASTVSGSQAETSCAEALRKVRS